MKITVIGCGRWGSLITWYLDRMGHDVTLYGMADAPEMQRFLVYTVESGHPLFRQLYSNSSTTPDGKG